ncbi:LAQU0S01e00166g1_1 [Lachancea quebecensis]|uniref:LAQU0S01e00166g1_1 n=1 Tax=Lachancea quebecensis TaxID=1654605 RepID=A0A0P1KLC4_9SACH|nr:LAQU0S01e00166g1_1 [Lachancea quebecensis]
MEKDYATASDKCNSSAFLNGEQTGKTSEISLDVDPYFEVSRNISERTFDDQEKNVACCSPSGIKSSCCDHSDKEAGENQSLVNPATDSSDACCQKPLVDVAALNSNSATDKLRDPVSNLCCTESCLHRATQQAIEMSSEALPKVYESTLAGKSEALPSIKPMGGQNDVECGSSLRALIYEQYSTRLKALGCLCRALVAEGKRSCCQPRTLYRAKRKQKSQSEEKGLLEADVYGNSGNSYNCATKTPSEITENVKQCNSNISDYESSSDSNDSVSSCNPGGKCCFNASSMKLCSGGCKEDSRRMEDHGNTTKLKESTARVCRTKNQETTEHVVLAIQGMTCTGCETKLRKTLLKVSGLNNLKTSLVLSLAEFDLDTQLANVNEVMKHLKRTSEFQCEQIHTKGMTIDLLITGDIKTFLNQEKPNGVSDVFVVAKNRVRVLYDPILVGARDLMNLEWASASELAPACNDLALKSGRKHTRHTGYMTVLSGVLTVPILVMAWAPLHGKKIAYSSASLALATLVQIFVAGPFYPKAIKALVFSGVIEMDLLIVLSTSAAYIFSVVSFGFLAASRPLSTEQFFETSSLLVTLIMVGRYVAALTRQKAAESISIRSLQPQNTLLLPVLDETKGEEIDVRLLQYGDVFMVNPDSRIPTDGIVVSGSSEVDESMLTGESRLVEKIAGSQVIAGTLNMSGNLKVRLSNLPGDNTINTIASMVDQAKLSKPKIQEIADRVASYFVPVVGALTVVTFVIWVAVGKSVEHKNMSEAVVQAVTYAIAVLIVSCPCAIGLAVPMVIVFSSGIAAQRGIIIKSASAIEMAHRTSHVVFDKTGTLTQGKLTVLSEHYFEDGKDWLPMLLGLVSTNKHPVSLALSNHLQSKGYSAEAVGDVRNKPGKGMEGQFSGKTVCGGNARWLNVQNHATVQQLLEQEQTTFCFTVNGVLRAIFGLKDSLRDEALEVVTELQSKGVSVHIVSGDDEGPVHCVTASLRIPQSNARARSSPRDKQLYVQKLLEGSNKNGGVIFCGDGINDAVALTQATIGVQIESASEIAQSAADVTLVKQDLNGLLTLMRLSKVSVRRIKFNFAWSFVYNFFAILLAAGAFVDFKIPPEYAGLGELISVVPVVVAALLLKRAKI